MALLCLHIAKEFDLLWRGPLLFTSARGGRADPSLTAEETLNDLLSSSSNSSSSRNSGSGSSGTGDSDEAKVVIHVKRLENFHMLQHQLTMMKHGAVQIKEQRHRQLEAQAVTKIATAAAAEQERQRRLATAEALNLETARRAHLNALRLEKQRRADEVRAALVRDTREQVKGRLRWSGSARGAPVVQGEGEGQEEEKKGEESDGREQRRVMNPVISVEMGEAGLIDQSAIIHWQLSQSVEGDRSVVESVVDSAGGAEGGEGSLAPSVFSLPEATGQEGSLGFEFAGTNESSSSIGGALLDVEKSRSISIRFGVPKQLEDTYAQGFSRASSPDVQITRPGIRPQPPQQQLVVGSPEEWMDMDSVDVPVIPAGLSSDFHGMNDSGSVFPEATVAAAAFTAAHAGAGLNSAYTYFDDHIGFVGDDLMGVVEDTDAALDMNTTLPSGLFFQPLRRLGWPSNAITRSNSSNSSSSGRTSSSSSNDDNAMGALMMAGLPGALVCIFPPSDVLSGSGNGARSSSDTTMHQMKRNKTTHSNSLSVDQRARQAQTRAARVPPPDVSFLTRKGLRKIGALLSVSAEPDPGFLLPWLYSLAARTTCLFVWTRLEELYLFDAASACDPKRPACKTMLDPPVSKATTVSCMNASDCVVSRLVDPTNSKKEGKRGKGGRAITAGSSGLATEGDEEIFSAPHSLGKLALLLLGCADGSMCAVLCSNDPHGSGCQAVSYAQSVQVFNKRVSKKSSLSDNSNGSDNSTTNRVVALSTTGAAGCAAWRVHLLKNHNQNQTQIHNHSNYSSNGSDWTPVACPGSIVCVLVASGELFSFRPVFTANSPGLVSAPHDVFYQHSFSWQPIGTCTLFDGPQWGPALKETSRTPAAAVTAVEEWSVAMDPTGLCLLVGGSDGRLAQLPVPGLGADPTNGIVSFFFSSFSFSFSLSCNLIYMINASISNLMHSFTFLII
jgi:hypothetical protein